MLCRVAKTFDGSSRKLLLKLRAGYENLEGIVHRALVEKAQAKPLYGQAPRGNLERKVQKALDERTQHDDEI